MLAQPDSQCAGGVARTVRPRPPPAGKHRRHDRLPEPAVQGAAAPGRVCRHDQIPLPGFLPVQSDSAGRVRHHQQPHQPHAGRLAGMRPHDPRVRAGGRRLDAGEQASRSHQGTGGITGMAGHPRAGAGRSLPPPGNAPVSLRRVGTGQKATLAHTAGPVRHPAGTGKGAYPDRQTGVHDLAGQNAFPGTAHLSCLLYRP